MITVALAKGRLAELAIEIFEKAGLDCDRVKNPGRKLIIECPEDDMCYILVKPSDVPTYVEYGAADIGIVGKDTLLEEGRSLYEMVDLKYGRCKMAVAGFADKKDGLITSTHTRVATKYVNIAKDYFSRRGETISIIKLNGSVELGPLVGLSDYIVDIVESGKTLKENGLEVIEEICDISARLVVNRVSLKTGGDRIRNFIYKIQEVVDN